MSTPPALRRASVVCALTLAAVLGFGAHGIAYASVDVLPNAPQGIPNTVADIVKGTPSWGVTVRGVAAEVTVGAAAAAGAAAAVPSGAVVGAVIGTGFALHMAWTQGNELGQMLPCWSCPGIDTPPTGHTFANGMEVRNIVFRGGPVAGASTQPNASGIFTAELYVPSSFTLCGSGCTPFLTAYYSASAGGAANGYGTSLNGNTFYNGQTQTLTRSGCVTGINSCGFGETPYLAGGCYGVYNTSSGLTYLARPYGNVPSGSCTAVVRNNSGSTSGVQQTPTSSTGGSSGSTPQPTAPLQLVSSAQCRPSAGGASYTVSKTSATFYENGSALPVVPVPACNGTDVRLSWTVKVHPLDGSFPDKTIIETGTLPSSPPADHPEWAPCYAGGAQFPCTLTLSRVLPDGTTRPYDPATDYKANPAEQPSSDPESWLCKWGTIRLPVAECATIYQQPPRVSPVPPATSGENCMSGALSWNPINWVYVPVKCALKWAFVPRAEVIQGYWSRVADGWCDTAPGVVACTVGDFFGPFTSIGVGASDDCQGAAINLPDVRPGHDDLEVHPWDACTEAAQAISDFWIPFSSGAIYIGCFLAGARILSRTIGADDAVPA